jgi:F0F1-type ATP synthase assembly protein I
MADEDRNGFSALAYAGVGVSFVAISGVMAFLGHLADRAFDTEPWLLVSGAMLGVVVATFDLLRTVNRIESGKRK